MKRLLEPIPAAYEKLVQQFPKKRLALMPDGILAQYDKGPHKGQWAVIVATGTDGIVRVLEAGEQSIAFEHEEFVRSMLPFAVRLNFKLVRKPVGSG